MTNTIATLALTCLALLLATGCENSSRAGNNLTCHGGSCSSSCADDGTTAPCNVVCESGSSCDASCNAGQSCNFECNAGATCNFDCTQSQCQVTGGADCSCSGDCLGTCMGGGAPGGSDAGPGGGGDAGPGGSCADACGDPTSPGYAACIAACG